MDHLYNAEECTVTLFPTKRVRTQNTHGTGCTLSSALAAALAKEENMTQAVKSATATDL